MNSSPQFQHATGEFRLATLAPDRLGACGPLTFATARLARLAGLEALRSGAQPLQIDCAGVTASDSAGLAVLLDWLAAAKLAGRRLQLLALPQGLLALGRISEVEQLLQAGV
ncbi:MAG TPA: STAS domain-containing protein [Steroidobacteraceae bacterium]|nr:STAS domain-containing protein [Steroidobacteraceae bacterium]